MTRTYMLKAAVGSSLALIAASVTFLSLGCTPKEEAATDTGTSPAAATAGASPVPQADGRMAAPADATAMPTKPGAK